jgi:hypothetical protein
MGAPRMAPRPSNTVVGQLEGTLLATRIRMVFVDHAARPSVGGIAMCRLLPALAPLADVHVVLGEDGLLVEQLETLGIDTEVMPSAARNRESIRNS